MPLVLQFSKQYLWACLLGSGNAAFALLCEDPRYEELIPEIDQAWGLNPSGSLPENTDMPEEPQADA